LILYLFLFIFNLNIIKEIEKATAHDITKSDIDVIGLLHIAQECNAQQLTKFCLHFISANYQVYQLLKVNFNLINISFFCFLKDGVWWK
jgi:Rho family protein